MKKVLLGTSALALAGAFASPAAAAEWNVRVGGYMEQFVAYADSDANFAGDYDGVDSKQDAEIHFLPSITLDNGIKFGANVQLEALTNSDQIDEAYMFIDGSFGRVVLGSENSAGYTMTYVAPDVTFINVNSGSTTSFVPWSAGGAGTDIFRQTLGSSLLENAGNNDVEYEKRLEGRTGAADEPDGDGEKQEIADDEEIENAGERTVDILRAAQALAQWAHEKIRGDVDEGEGDEEASLPRVGQAEFEFEEGGGGLAELLLKSIEGGPGGFLFTGEVGG